MDKSAREIFRKGDRVRMTDEAMRRHLRRERGIGTVVGFGQKPHLVTVVIDGLKTRSAYHQDFWEVLPEER